MTHTPSLAVYKNKQFLDELYRRVHIGALSVELLSSGEGYAHISVSTGKGADRYAFEAMAYLPKTSHISVAPV